MELAEDGGYRGRHIDHPVESGECAIGNGAVSTGYLPDGQHAEECGDDDADEDVAGDLEDE